MVKRLVFASALVAALVSGCVCDFDAAVSRCVDGGLCTTGAGGAGGGSGAGGGTGGGGADGGVSHTGLAEIVSSGAHMTGNTLTLDVEVGHPTARTTMTGGTLTVTGSAAVRR